MRVDPECRRCIRMSEPTAHRPHWHTRREELRRVRVTKIVETDTGETESVAQRDEVVAHIVRVPGPAAIHSVTEDVRLVHEFRIVLCRLR